MKQPGEKQIEPELCAPPPRQVKRRGTRGGGIVFSQLLVLPLAAMSLFMLAWSAHMAWVRLGGPVAPAAIVDRSIEHDDEGKTLHYLAFRYSFKGNRYDRRSLVTHEVYESAPPGRAVRVQLSPLWPGLDPLLLVAGNKVWEDVILLAIGGVITLAGVGAMVWYVFVVPARDRALLVRGVPVMGRIAGKNFTESQRSRYYYLQYEYQPSPSAPLPGQGAAQETGLLAATQRVREADYNGAAEGEFFTVLHDPRRPTRSTIYAFADFKVI